MSVSFYFDVHVKRAITDQLRLRGVDIITAQEDGADRLSDEELLGRATALGRPIFTQDNKFKGLAESWQRNGKAFAGMFFGHQTKGTVGQYVKDLELIAKASEPADWISTIEHLPY